MLDAIAAGYPITSLYDGALGIPLGYVPPACPTRTDFQRDPGYALEFLRWGYTARGGRS